MLLLTRITSSPSSYVICAVKLILYCTTLTGLMDVLCALFCVNYLPHC